MSRPRPYTRGELAVLRRDYGRVPDSELCERLGRSLHSIQVMASRLGLKKGFFHIKWTEDMLTMLRFLYPTTFNRDLAVYLGVSETTLHRKARELKLTKADDFRERRLDDMKRKLSASLRAVPCATRFAKGRHYNPENEFKPGRKPTEEEMRKRVETRRRNEEHRKRLRRLGLNENI